MNKHILRGLSTAAPAALLAALLSNKENRLINSVLWGLGTGVGVGGLSYLRDNNTGKVNRPGKDKHKSTTNDLPAAGNTTDGTKVGTDSSSNMSKRLNLADELSWLRYRPRSIINDMMVEVDLKNSNVDNNNNNSDIKKSSPQSNKASNDNKSIKHKLRPTDVHLYNAEMQAQGARALANDIKHIYKGIVSKNDYGIPRLGAMEYLRFLGGVTSEAFAKAWASTARAVDKGLSAAEKSERKLSEAKRALARPGSISYHLMGGDNPGAATSINDLTSLALNPDNPKEYRQQLADGTARTDLYRSFIEDEGNTVNQLATKMRMTPAQLSLARGGAEWLINFTTDPLTAASMGTAAVLSKVGPLSAAGEQAYRAARLRKLRHIRALRNKSIGGKAWQSIKYGSTAGAKGLATMMPETTLEAIETQSLPHYDLAMHEVAKAVRIQARIINKQRQERGLTEIPEDALVNYLNDKVSWSGLVNVLRERQIRKGNDVYGLIHTR